MEFFLESSFSFDDCAMHPAVYNGSKLDGSDRVPLSVLLVFVIAGCLDIQAILLLEMCFWLE
jgi:hypothetical protein